MIYYLSNPFDLFSQLNSNDFKNIKGLFLNPPPAPLAINSAKGNPVSSEGFV